MLSHAYTNGKRAALARFKLAEGLPMHVPGLAAHPFQPAAGGSLAASSLHAPFPGRGPAPVMPAPRAPMAAPGGFKMPGGALGLAGLGAAGALAYGAHQEHNRDREQQGLVYSPMPGSFAG